MNDVVLSRFGIFNDGLLDTIIKNFVTGNRNLNDARYSYPRVTAYETDKELVIKATVPGLTKDDVVVQWADDILSIKYAKQSDNIKNGKEYCLREIHESSFYRALTVSQDRYDIDKIIAKVENGMLYVTMPLKEPRVVTSKTISVE